MHEYALEFAKSNLARRHIYEGDPRYQAELAREIEMYQWSMDAATGVAGTVGRVGEVTSEWHHIASNKAIKSGFTEAYERIFKKAGMSLEDDANKMRLEGHSGAHTKVYKQYVLEALQEATEGLQENTKAFEDAVIKSLGELKSELLNNPRMPFRGGL